MGGKRGGRARKVREMEKGGGVKRKSFAVSKKNSMSLRLGRKGCLSFSLSDKKVAKTGIKSLIKLAFVPSRSLGHIIF